MSQSVRNHPRTRAAHPANSRALVAGVALALLAGCAYIPNKQPIVQQPMTAVPPAPPVNMSAGAIYNPGYAGRPLFEDQRPRNTGDILTIVISENINATKSSGAPTVSTPGQNGSGTLNQGYVESSNVNVVQELVNMIETQRAYEINSKAVTTSDQMLQTLSQMQV